MVAGVAGIPFHRAPTIDRPSWLSGLRFRQRHSSSLQGSGSRRCEHTTFDCNRNDAQSEFLGLSGRTEFPHLHFTVRHRGRLVDPFAFGAVAGSCGGGASLWKPATAKALEYRARAVLNEGFAGAAGHHAADRGWRSRTYSVRRHGAGPGGFVLASGKAGDSGVVGGLLPFADRRRSCSNAIGPKPWCSPAGSGRVPAGLPAFIGRAIASAGTERCCWKAPSKPGYDDECDSSCPRLLPLVCGHPTRANQRCGWPDQVPGRP